MPSKLRQRIGNWIAGTTGARATTSPFDFEPQTADTFGPGIGNQPRVETLLQESRGIFNAAKRTLANRVASLEPLVKVRRRTKAGTVEDEILDDHVLKKLLDRPHPNLSRRQVMRLTTEWLVDAGEAYWIKVGNGFGVPSEVQLAKPGNMWPVVRGNRVVAYRVIDARGNITTLPADAVVRFYLPDPENPWGAEGYLSPMGIQADSLKFAGQHLRSHYQHDATPKSFLEAGPEAKAPGEAQFDRFLALWKKHYNNREGERRGLPGIGPAGYRLIQLAFQSGADVAPLLEHWREDLLMGIGTPKSVLGLVQSGDRSSAETNFWVYDAVTVEPMASLIAEAITLQLAPDFDSSLIVEFEPFSSEDKEFKLRQEASDIGLSLRTPNKVLTDRGDDPVPWGDAPLRLGNLGPAAGGTPPVQAPPGGGGGAPAAAAPGEGAEVDLEPGAEEAEPERLRARADADTEEEEEEAAAAAAAAAALVPVLVEPLDDEELHEALRAIIAATVVAFGAQAFELAGTEGTLDVTDEVVAEYLESGEAERLREVTATTKAELAEAVKSVAAAASIAAAVRAVFKRASKERAPTIARTTTVPAANFGMEQGIAQSGVALKDWVSERDDVVRDTHVELDNSDPIPVDDDFESSSGASGPYPGALGDPAEDINCRCIVVPAGPSQASDDAGRLWVTREQRDAVWRRQDDLRLVYEQLALRATRKVFVAQEKAVLAALKGRERALHIMVRRMIRGGAMGAARTVGEEAIR